ncbi:XRE family transcriptional regulator [Lacticaseibacillus rhamnosus]|nr:XRE family transcriptional regulator [Lacticaseibacillus rhamnosus]
MHLNQIIRTKRLAAGLTQEALAQKVGVTSPAVSKWEKGISYPDITLLPILARNLNTDVNTLLDFSADLDPAALRRFYTKLTATAQKDGWKAAVALVDEELREYPSVPQLQNLPSETVAYQALKLKLQLSQGQFDKAYVDGEQLLTSDFSALTIVLNLLTQVAIADHQLATAQLYVDTLLKFDAVFNMYSPWAIDSQLRLAKAANKPKEAIAILQKSIDKIDRKIPAVLKHLPKLQPIASLTEAQKQLAQSFAADPELDYLKDDPEFQKLIHQFDA